MRVTPAIPIGAAQVISTNIAEPSAGETVYNAGSTYMEGDKVVSLTTHKQYTSLRGRSSTVTISQASPGVLTWRGHDCVTGDPIVLSTGGTLPAPLAAGTYYAKPTGVDTMELSLTAGGASINTTTAGGGTHTAKASPNIGYPLPVEPIKITDWWKETGSTDKLKPFDMRRNSRVVGGTAINYTFAPGRRGNTLAILGTVTDTITVTCRTGSEVGPIVYTATSNQRRRRIFGAFSYCFEPFDRAPSFVMFDIPLFTNIYVTVELARNDGGNCELGTILYGTSYYVGETQISAESDLENFTVFETDELTGETEITPRPSVPLSNQTTKCPNQYLGKALDLREALNGVAALWTGLDDGTDDRFELVLLLGIYLRWRIVLDEYQDATFTFELKEI